MTLSVMTFSIMTLDMKDSCLVYKYIKHKTFYIVCHYAECSYGEDHALFTVVLNVVKVIAIMLNVAKVIVIMLNAFKVIVIMLNVVKVIAIMLNVVLLSVVVPP
jgi:hypothetical protein